MTQTESSVGASATQKIDEQTMTLKHRGADSQSGFPDSTVEMVHEVEDSLEDHIKKCGERHAVIHTKLDSIEDSIRELRSVVMDMLRSDGEQTAKIDSLQQARSVGLKAGVLSGGSVAALVGAAYEVGKNLGWW